MLLGKRLEGMEESEDGVRETKNGWRNRVVGKG